MKLSELHCEFCPKGTPTVSAKEQLELLIHIPLWRCLEVNGELQLQRQFKFTNFTQALAFTNRVAEISELQDHHPAMLLEWSKVTVSFWTHTIAGLHRNDFIMAAKTDTLY